MAQSEYAKASEAMTAAARGSARPAAADRRDRNTASEQKAYGTSELSVESRMMNVKSCTRLREKFAATSAVANVLPMIMPAAGVSGREGHADGRGKGQARRP